MSAPCCSAQKELFHFDARTNVASTPKCESPLIPCDTPCSVCSKNRKTKSVVVLSGDNSTLCMTSLAATRRAPRWSSKGDTIIPPAAPVSLIRKANPPTCACGKRRFGFRRHSMMKKPSPVFRTPLALSPNAYRSPRAQSAYPQPYQGRSAPRSGLGGIERPVRKNANEFAATCFLTASTDEPQRRV
jgi:hypothetical protein